MLKIMLFIDGTWLYSNTSRLANSYGKADFHLDYGRLPRILADEIGEQLNKLEVHVVRTYLFGSYAENCDPIDQEVVVRRLNFFSRLKEEYHYEVQLFPVDFMGKRLRKMDRGPQDDFDPREKCVDIALATTMLYYAAMPNAYDVAIAVIGDRDFVPVLQHVRRLGKQAAIASIKGTCAKEFSAVRDEAGVRDFDVVWLDDLLHRLELKYERHQLECQSPSHVGDRRVWTTYHPRKYEKFFCDACRGAFAQRQEVQDRDQGNFNRYPEAADSGIQVQPGMEIGGTVKAAILDKGYGFILGDDGQSYYFHVSGMVDTAEFDSLMEGNPVEFRVDRAPNPMAFAVEQKRGVAQGVRVRAAPPPNLPCDEDEGYDEDERSDEDEGYDEGEGGDGDEGSGGDGRYAEG